MRGDGGLGGVRLGRWHRASWIPIWAFGTGAAACDSERDSLTSQSNGPDIIEAGADPSLTREPNTAPESIDPTAAAEGSTSVTSAPATPPASAVDGGVEPVASAPVDPAPATPTATASSPLRANAPSAADAGANPEPTSSPTASVDVPEQQTDAGATATASDPAPVDEPPVGAPNVPTEIDVLPLQCRDSASTDAEGCSLRQACGSTHEYGFECQAAQGDWGCSCMYGSPALDFQFTSTALEQACDASATICDPARGIALATRDCGPSSESASVNACRTEVECTYQWQIEGAMAHSSARSESAACSRNADTDKWSCACSFDDTAWVTYSFVADTSVGSACGSAFDVCAKFDALVPELGADCELAPVVAGEASCLEAASCRFYASVDGTRISMKLGMNISCAQQSSGVVCYLETDQETMEVAAPSENASEACAAFTSDDLVGLVSLPASSH